MQSRGRKQKGRFGLRRIGVVTAIATAAVLVVLAATGTLANWPGSITNNTNTVATATLTTQVKYTNGFSQTTCTIPIRSSVPSPACSFGSLFNVSGISASALGGSAQIIPGGTATAAQRQTTGAWTIPSTCPAQSLTNSKDSTNPLLPRANLTGLDFRMTGATSVDPWGTNLALRIGNQGYSTGVVSKTSPAGQAAGFSMGLWFKVSGSGKGGLMSFDDTSYNAPTGAATTSSPALWLDTSNGRLAFRVAGTAGGQAVGATPAGVPAAGTNGYADGVWHFVVLSVAPTPPLGLTSTVTMFPDNTTSPVTVSGLTLLTGGTGFWHVAWADSTSMTLPAGGGNIGGNATAAGLFSGAWVRNAPTTAAEFTTLKAAGSASAYKSAVLGLSGIDQMWMLDDDGQTTYSGAIPGVTNICGMAQVNSYGMTSPVCTIVASGSPVTFDTLLGRTTNCPVSAPGVTQTVAISYQKSATYAAAADRIRLKLPISYSIYSAPGTGWAQTFIFNTYGHVLVM